MTATIGDNWTLPVHHDRRRRGPIFNGVYVFVWCESCQRYISDEDRHHCVLHHAIEVERMRRRVVKHREMGHE